MIKELIELWDEYSKVVEKRRYEDDKLIMEVYKKQCDDYKEEVERIKNEPNPKCLFTGKERRIIKRFPPMPTPIFIPSKKPTIEGFLDWLKDKQSNKKQ